MSDGTAKLTSVEQFNGYPVDSACVVFGILFMVVLENVSRGMLAELGHHHEGDMGETTEASLTDDAADHHPSCGGTPGACTTLDAITKRSSSSSHKARKAPELRDIESLVLPPALTASQVALAARASIEALVDGSAAAAQVSQQQQQAETSGHCEDDHGSMQGAHTHGCVAVNTAANAPLPTMQSQGDVRYKITAYMFELACVIHSVLIGVALGVTVSDRSQVVALLVVLIFHQALEGVGLGSTVVRAGFSLHKSYFMIGLYSITTPIGIAIGIGVSSVYDPDSLTAKVVEGVLDSVSGGLMLYIAMVQLIAEDFSKSQQGKVWVRVASHFGLIIGAASFAVFAIWT